VKGYGKIPIKDVETAPWVDVCIDLAGPWKTKIDGKPYEFHTLTMIDPFTSWLEIIPIHNKTAGHIVSLIEQEWLRRYPRPSRMIYDQGGEFLNQEMHTLHLKWFFKKEPISVQNPQANAIVERLHRMMGDMMRTKLVKHHAHDDPIRDICTAVAYGIRATVHGTTKMTPAQLVFQKDMILRTNVEVNMEFCKNINCGNKQPKSLVHQRNFQHHESGYHPFGSTKPV
jgi:hypothetical protein